MSREGSTALDLRTFLQRILYVAIDNVGGERGSIVVPDKPPSIWVDEDMIRRVLINLLENASKFTPPEGKLEVGVKTDGEWVQLWVADNGDGIALEDRARVFEKYESTISGEKTAGLGVGLTFCRLAVDGHRENIWVDNDYKAGTRFNINLPRVKKE